MKKMIQCSGILFFIAVLFSQGYSQGDNQEKLVITPGDTTVNVGDSIQFIAQFKDTSGALSDTLAQWSLRGNQIGTISETGLLSVLQPGVGLVKATLDGLQKTALITAIDTTTDSSGVNTIQISRVLPDSMVLPPQTVQEGNVFVLGGVPHPLNVLNGAQVYFPSASLDNDITVQIQLPEFAQVSQDTVQFGDGNVAGITFKVFVNDTLVEPFFFNIPVNVAIPFKRGLLNKLGISPDSLDLFFAEGGGVFENTGITNVIVDSSANRIFGQIAHFSTLVVRKKEGTVVSVEENIISGIPEQFVLQQNYPNPFNPETKIAFRIPERAHVTLRIYNLLGQQINSLFDKVFEAGSHSVLWDGKNLNGAPVASGIYLYRLDAGEFSQVKKMTLIR